MDPDGPAAAAGVEPGDTFVYLTYEPDNPTVAVEGLIQRGDTQLPLRYLPADGVFPGRRWKRDRRVDDAECY